MFDLCNGWRWLACGVGALVLWLPGCGDPEEWAAPPVAVAPKQVGEACAAATECAEPLICVYTTLDGSPKSCVDPSVGVYDDGTDSALRVLDTGKAWIRKRVDNWDTDGLVCNDGSPYGYYISKGSGAGANKWLVFFKGGSNCPTEEDCAIRWAIEPQYMRQWRTLSPNYTPTNAAFDQAAGLYARTEASNHFRDWNFVHLHYCSSDQLTGTNGADQNPARLHFRGSAIAASVVSELLDGVDLSSAGVSMPAMAAAEEVVIAGGSAGAVAARRNVDRLASLIKERSASIRVRGLFDAAIAPVIHWKQYVTGVTAPSLWGFVGDLDCSEAHADDPARCDDDVHMFSGHGTADYYGVADEGHVTVAGSSEAGAADGYFILMAQRDAMTTTGLRITGQCVHNQECSAHADCGAGRGCLGGVCFTVEPCAPQRCTPADGACYGVGDPPSCLGGVATHANVCDDNAACPGGANCCPTGETCVGGYCVQDGFGGCTATTDCPDGFLCDDGVCSKGAETEADCQAPGYQYENDTHTCDQILGCNDARPCGADYSCMGSRYTPGGETLAWGLRTDFTGLGPNTGSYLPNSTTHTVSSGPKFYGVNMPLINGLTAAQAANAWFSDAPGWFDQVSPPDNIPLPLWAWDALDLSAVGLSTSGTGCANSAYALLVCDVASACAAPADALAVLGVGDTGTGWQDGVLPAGGVMLKIVVGANPACTATTLTAGADAALAFSYRFAAAATSTHTVRIALPAGDVGAAALPLTLYVGADGACYTDMALTTLVAGRID